MSPNDGSAAVRVLPGFFLLLAGCAEGPEETCDAPVSSAEQTESSEWLLLSPEQRSSVARLSASALPEEPLLCTATVISTELAITADHCRDATTMTLISDSHEYDLPILEWISHPVFDLAVLRFAPEELPEEAVPLPALFATPSGRLEGMLVEVAGYGVTEVGTTGELKFSVQQIAFVEEELAVVLDGMGAWLACAGDSGGPLLLRDEQGIARVAGVLSTAAFDCMGQARYLYLPAFADWLAEVGGLSDDAPGTNCGELTQAGRCFHNGPAWCEAEALEGDTCAADEQCGWDAEQAGFRCISPELDPCSGVSEQGQCEDGVAVRCAEGQLEEEDCHACGNECGRSPATGLVECRSVSLK